MGRKILFAAYLAGVLGSAFLLHSFIKLSILCSVEPSGEQMGFPKDFRIILQLHVSIQHLSHDWSIPGNNIGHILHFFHSFKFCYLYT